MPRLNKLLTGHDITDEVINRTSSTSLKLDHDTMLASSVVVRTAAGGGGTLLTLTTDYTLGSEDSALSIEAGDTIYTKVAIVNGAYHSMDLYVTYKSVGDYVDVVDGFPIGGMTPYGGASAPTGWLLCDGSAVSRTTYYALFTAIGTTWGVGNGSTTFNVPDMRESSPYGAGTYSAVTGTTHGAITAHDALALGAFGDDQGQGHSTRFVSTGGTFSGQSGEIILESSSADSTPTSGLTYIATGSTSSSVRARGNFQVTTDGTNGTPRQGTVTRGKIIGVNYIIKY